MSALSQKRSPKFIKPGDVITWDEILCLHRGTTKPRRVRVDHVDRRTIVTKDGNYLDWFSLRGKLNLKIESAADPEATPKDQQKP